MLRLDAHHSFLPPNQGPEWFARILSRNRFEGSVYAPQSGTVEEALELARRFPYIRRVVPLVVTEDLDRVPEDPLIASLQVLDPTPGFLSKWKRGIEIPAARWPIDVDRPVALIGLPSVDRLPGNIYVKLTGFTLPLSTEMVDRLKRLLRHPGPERLMFASAWPHGGGTWKESLAAFTQALGAMPQEVREQILGRTACEFYGIA